MATHLAGFADHLGCHERLAGPFHHLAPATTLKDQRNLKHGRRRMMIAMVKAFGCPLPRTLVVGRPLLRHALRSWLLNLK